MIAQHRPRTERDAVRLLMRPKRAGKAADRRDTGRPDVALNSAAENPGLYRTRDFPFAFQRRFSRWGFYQKPQITGNSGWSGLPQKVFQLKRAQLE